MAVTLVPSYIICKELCYKFGIDSERVTGITIKIGVGREPAKAQIEYNLSDSDCQTLLDAIQEVETP